MFQEVEDTVDFLRSTTTKNVGADAKIPTLNRMPQESSSDLIFISSLCGFIRVFVIFSRDDEVVAGKVSD